MHSYWPCTKDPNIHSCLLTPAVFVFSGFMQFVQSVPVAEILATEGNIQVGHSDTLWLIQCSMLLDSGSFSCFGSVARWIWNETRSMRFHLLKTRPMLKFPKNLQELKIGALQWRVWFKIFNLSKYLQYTEILTFYTVYRVYVEKPVK